MNDQHQRQEQVGSIVDTLSYASAFYGKTILIKLGGSLLSQTTLVQSLCEDLGLLAAVGIKIVLVHGGSRAIQVALTAYGITSEFKEGLRVTSAAAIEVIEMVLCGQVNQQLQRMFNRFGVKTVGLSGAENQLLLCERYSTVHGCVGRIKTVNSAVLMQLLQLQEQGTVFVPVIAPLGIDAAGQVLNVNADAAAAHIANSLQVDKLIYLTDQDGIYDEKGLLCSELFDVELQQLIAQGVVRDGMLIKSQSILASLAAHLNEVCILNGSQPHVLIKELFTKQGVGTLCKASQKKAGIFD